MKRSPSAFAARAFGDQQAVAAQRRGVVLDHLHVHELRADAVGLRNAVAGDDQPVRRRPVHLAGSARGEDHRLGVDQLETTVAEVAADRSDAAAVVID
jgi:hypothetical protein